MPVMVPWWWTDCLIFVWWSVILLSAYVDSSMISTWKTYIVNLCLKSCYLTHCQVKKREAWEQGNFCMWKMMPMRHSQWCVKVLTQISYWHAKTKWNDMSYTPGTTLGHSLFHEQMKHRKQMSVEGWTNCTAKYRPLWKLVPTLAALFHRVLNQRCKLFESSV